MKRWFLVLWVAHWTAQQWAPRHCSYRYEADPYTSVKPKTIFGRWCSELRPWPMEKEFETEEQARQFMDGCPKGVCSDWILEEVHL